MQEGHRPSKKKHPIKVLQQSSSRPQGLCRGNLKTQDGGRVSSPLSESMLQILPCTVVPPNLDMG